jgi:succinate dehydrogenase/fumarate reductase flavoprotein subunit
VPFNRTSEGRHDLRLFGGSLYKRTHFAGATTGQQLLYSLDEQARSLGLDPEADLAMPAHNRTLIFRRQGGQVG